MHLFSESAVKLSLSRGVRRGEIAAGQSARLVEKASALAERGNEFPKERVPASLGQARCELAAIGELRLGGCERGGRTENSADLGSRAEEPAEKIAARKGASRSFDFCTEAWNPNRPIRFVSGVDTRAAGS